MKKKLLAIVLATATMLSLTACGTAKSSGPLTLVYAEVNPEDTIVGQVAADFKSKVEELSNGQIIIDVQYSGVLGSENDVLDAMLAGIADEMPGVPVIGNTSFTGRWCPEGRTPPKPCGQRLGNPRPTSWGQYSICVIGV